MKKCNLILIALAISFNFTLKSQVTVSQSYNANGSYTSIKAAFDRINNYSQANHDILVTITGNTTESRSIQIEDKGWKSLTIVASTATTVTFNPGNVDNQNALFYFNSGVNNVTINGGDNTNRYLTLVGAYNINPTSSSTYTANNSIILFGGNTNDIKDITIENCIFTGNGTDDRSVHAIVGDATNITIRNNIFKNCLNINNDIQFVTVIDGHNVQVGGTGGFWEITGNHFFEENNLTFTKAISRAFISLKSETPTCYFLVKDNFIGGRDTYCGYNAGIYGAPLTMGNQAPIVNEQPTDLYAINILFGDIKDATQSIVSGNKIANITGYNHSNSIKRFDKDPLGITDYEAVAEFCGILSQNGKILVQNNTVEEIVWNTTLTTDAGSSKYTIRGIAGIVESPSGSNPEFICDGNKVYNLRLKTGSGIATSCQIMHYMISAHVTGGKAVLKNNRVIWGYNNPGFVYGGDVYGIGGKASGSWGRSLNIHDNICVLEELNLYDNLIWSIDLFKMVGENGDANNDPGNVGSSSSCFNNIAYVQPKAADAFNINNVPYSGGIGSGRICGINIISYTTTDANSLNIFHNTFYIKDIHNNGDAAYTTTALSIQNLQDNNAGNHVSADIWNNIFANDNTDGTSVYVSASNGLQGGARLDYNTYQPGTGYFSIIQEDIWAVTSSFDEWKFGNNSASFNRSTNHSHHGRFLNPNFKNTSDITLSFAGIEDLRTNLQPQRFLGGRKTEDNILTAIGVTDDTNTDFSITPLKRRPYLPTMGAINTGFSNYWTGSTGSDDWNTANNWADKNIPADDEDVVFAPQTANNAGDEICVNKLVLDKARKVHDIYNDTPYHLELNGMDLTLTGYIGQERGTNANYAKVNATKEGSSIIYNGSIAQHIFENTFVDNQVYNFTLDNGTDYFVLLHDQLDIKNNFSIENPAEIPHKGALNCVWFNTQLKFSGSKADGNNIPQEIPQHAIYNDSVYNLIINSDKVITNHDNLYIKSNLTIGEQTTDIDKSFEITAGKYVKVDGLTTNRGGTSGLIIRSRSNLSDNTPNATFIFSNSSSDPKIPATVEMFSPAHKDEQGNYKWQYFTVPVEETPITTEMWGSWIRRWEPTGVNRNSYYGTPYWIYVEDKEYLSPTGNATYSYPSSNTSSYPLQGYEITMSVAKVIPFKGNLLNNDFSLELNYHQYNSGIPSEEEWDEQNAMNGQYVIGNPYTAAIDIKKLDFGTNLDSTVYIYTTGSYNDWKGNYGGGLNPSGTNSGQYQAVPVNNAGNLGLSSQISSMQGFVIMRRDNTGNTAANTFKLKYNSTETDQTVSKNNAIQRSASITQKNIAQTSIDLSSEHYSDRLWIFLNPVCKKGYDNGWDGYKYINMTAAAQLFTIEDDEYYQVSTMDDINDTYIGFADGKEDTEYTLTFNHEDMGILYDKIELHDLIDNVITDITQNGSTYTFYSKEGELDLQPRFKITAKAETPPLETEITTSDMDGIYIYTREKTIFINNTTDASGKIFIYDIHGRCLMARELEALKVMDINTGLKTGSYIVKITTSTGVTNQSLILK